MNIRESAEFDRIARRWAKLKNILGGLDPRTLDSLYLGVDDAAVDRLRALLAVPLPVELEALYRMNDGEGRLYEAVEASFSRNSFCRSSQFPNRRPTAAQANIPS